ncbi:MAG: hypothetical protein JWQ25_2413 [Daejeonella sp.]|nr:hypothetical protein [Daejeonella sp.]
MMRQPTLFNLNTIIADGLEEIKSLKNIAVGLQQYEETAKLRDIEKTFLQLEEELSKGLFPTLTHTITENTQQYFDQIFAYCFFQDWKNISAHFSYALINRKEQLNKIFQFTEEQKNRLLTINNNFAKLEQNIIDGYQTKQALSNIRSLKSLLGSCEIATITIRCYSNNEAYSFLNNQEEPQNIFYRMEVASEVFMGQLIAFQEDRESKYRKSRDLVMDDLNSKGFNHDICPMLLLFLSISYLAWLDVLNIDDVAIGLNVSYKI